MPGVEAEGGTAGGESDEITPPTPTKKQGEERSEDTHSQGGLDTEEKEEEEGKSVSVPSPPTTTTTTITTTIRQLFSTKIMLACKLSLLFLALIIVVHSR